MRDGAIRPSGPPPASRRHPATLIHQRRAARRSGVIGDDLCAFLTRPPAGRRRTVGPKPEAGRRRSHRRSLNFGHKGDGHGGGGAGRPGPGPSWPVGARTITAVTKSAPIVRRTGTVESALNCVSPAGSRWQDKTA